MSKASLLSARKPRGFQDRLDRQIAGEERLVAAIAGVYERWGFSRLETPAVEFTDALGKYLPDVDRPNEGVFAFKDDDAEWVSLRYDLTAPLARFVAENWNDLPRPFRRWQVGPVWRNEKPGPGRYRQFTQCDADSVGVPGVAADAEIVMMAAEAIEAAGIARGDYAFKINTRRLLNGLLNLATGAEASAARRTTVLRAIDKLDRLGAAGVAELLGRGRKDESGDFTPGADLDRAAIDRVMAFLKSGAPSRRETLRNLEAVLKGSADGEAGIADLAAIADILDRCGVDDGRAAFDPSIVRGLDYYTGPVFEAHLKVTSPETGKPVDFGSVGGGGRYDDLVARFRGEAVPATGFSFGVSRLLAALDAAGRAGGGDAPGPVVVLAFEKDRMPDYQAMAAELRAAGVRAEVYLGGAGVKAQLKYADRRGAPVAVIQGSDEREKGEVTLKDLVLGAELAREIKDNTQWREGERAQVTVARDRLVEAVKGIVAKRRA